MPRLVPSGTPSKTNRYVFPPGPWRLYGVSLGIALGVLVLLVAGLRRGFPSVGSPGKLTSAHAPFETRCAACHTPRVADARCERCHDPFGSNQFQNAGHVWFGNKNPEIVAKATVVECARCHVDHRGRGFSMEGVDDRHCAGCHFPSLAKHPEFALVKAGIQQDEGLTFSHRKHAKPMLKARLDRCEYCHELTRDKRGFQPLNFDRHCGKCHLPKGSLGATDPIPADLVVLPQQIGAAWAAARPPVAPDNRGMVIVPKLAHKDPWVLYNLWRFASELDPGGFARKRQALQAKVTSLSAEISEPPARAFSVMALRRQERDLTARLAGLSEDGAHAGERRRIERSLERIKTGIELGPSVMTAPRRLDWDQIDSELRRARSELADFDMGSGARSPLSPEERARRLAAVSAMTAPCVLCHVYNEGVMAPVRATVPMLGRATYTHLPHLEQIGCLDCHSRALASNKARDVLLPDVASCRQCHRPAQSRSDCLACHIFHPPSEPWPPI